MSESPVDRPEFCCTRFLGVWLTIAAFVAPWSAQSPEEGERIRLTARVNPNVPDDLGGVRTVPAPIRSDYRVGRQDLLEIRVFDVDELDQTVRVSDDGAITMPLLGRLQVVGLTKSELERMIASLLEEQFVQNPQVTVFVKEYESKKIAVSGAVKKPGTYEMLGSKTLLEMISMAGGLDQDLGKEIIIFRTDPDSEETRRIPVDLQTLVYRADPSLNLTVVPGDIIYVPNVEKISIYVSGAVKNPNLYEIPSDEAITVLKAVTLAGGISDRAASRRVQIMRVENDGSRISFQVDLKKIKRGKAEDPILRPDDIVLVPEAFF